MTLRSLGRAGAAAMLFPRDWPEPSAMSISSIPLIARHAATFDVAAMCPAYERVYHSISTEHVDNQNIFTR